MWANVSFGQDFRQVILHWWQGQDSAAVHCREYRAVLAKLPPGLGFKTNAQSQLLPSHCTLKIRGRPLFADLTNFYSSGSSSQEADEECEERALA